MKHVSRKEWVAASLIVSKNPTTMFQLTMDYRPINSSRVKTAWTMPHIDAVLRDVQGKKNLPTFTSAVDIGSYHWSRTVRTYTTS